jgi:hypothetical protein
MGRSFRRLRRQPDPDVPREEIVVTVDPPASPAAALTYLSEAEIFACEPIAWGSNYSFVVALRQGDEQRLAVYKPRRGEIPLWDFPDGTLYRREYAAFLVTQALGWEVIPPTVIRDGPHGEGTVQWFVDHDPRADTDGFVRTNQDDLMRLALFDDFANNADRKSTHLLRARDGKLWGIDHGLTFNVQSKLRTVIHDFCGQPIPEAIKAEMAAFLDSPARVDALTTELREHLDRAEVGTFYTRFERLLKTGRFRKLDPYQNVPRGWW